MCRFWVITAAVLGTIVPAIPGRADTASPSARAGQTAWAPKLYGFCMDVADAKHRSLPEQARMLRELGFDGAAYRLWFGEELDRNLRTLDEAGLKVYMLETQINIARPDETLLETQIPQAFRKLKGRPVAISVQLQGFPPGDPRGEAPAVKILRRLGDLAAASGLRISIYNHVGTWTESALFAMKIVKKTDHPQVGGNFNLCHWLMVDGQNDYRPVLRQNAAKIFVVTINGAKLGSKTWTNGLIQPLDQGDFDNRRLLSTLRGIGYHGPIGLMCYGIPGDARKYLERSMREWKTWQAEFTQALRDPGEFPVEAAFIPLAPGAVEPAGWLRDWAEAAGDGITGHLDEYHPTFHDLWKNLKADRRTAWQTNEGYLDLCAYWLDGLVRLGYILHDEHLIRKATDRLNLVVEGVNRGGNSFFYWQKKPPKDFLGWTHSHMGRALVAWYEASGNKRVLDALVKVYAQHPAPMGRLRFDAGDTYIVSGLCDLDAMLETYRFSGDRRILERVRAAMDAAEVQTALHEWAGNQFLPGHAVYAYEQIRLPALFYLATGQQSCLEASRQAFHWIDENHLLPYGVSSGMEFQAGIGCFRCTETCDVIAQNWSNIWLYRITGERSFGDNIERAFFNAGPAPIARDFQTMSYYQSPNRIQAGSLPADQPDSPGIGCHLFTQLGYPPVLCCVAAVNRLVPNYVTHMWMATQDHGLAATLYGPCKVSAAVAGTPLKLTCQTAYPFEESIRVKVEPEQPATFPLYFRIPGWCAKPRIAVNRIPLAAVADAKGFVRIERRWIPGDAVVLDFPRSVKVSRGFETEYPPLAKDYFSFKPPTAFQKRRLPYESISYGPLLFALAIPDKDSNTPVADARWQYALDNEGQRDGADIAVKRYPMPAKWDWPLAAPLTLEAPARAFDWRPTDDQALPAAPVEAGRAETIRLIPYGCTKFRISMFPVTARSWQAPASHK